MLAVVWAVWHVPLIFIPGTSQRFAPFLGFTIVLIGYSFFFAAIREVAGKRTMAGLVAHGWGNAFVALPDDRDGRRGSTAALLDLGGPDPTGRCTGNDHSVEKSRAQASLRCRSVLMARIAQWDDQSGFDDERSGSADGRSVSIAVTRPGTGDQRRFLGSSSSRLPACGTRVNVGTDIRSCRDSGSPSPGWPRSISFSPGPDVFALGPPPEMQ